MVWVKGAERREKAIEVEMKWSKFEDLLAGEVCLSLINEPLDDLGSLLNERLSAREIARRRWGMEKRIIRPEHTKEPTK